MKILSSIDAISTWAGKIAGLLFLVVPLIILYEVILRYGFNAPTRWVYESTLHLCAVVYLIGGAYTLYAKGHIIIDIFYEGFSPRVRAVFDLITSPLFFLFCGVLLWEGTQEAWKSLLIGETSGSPWNPPVYTMRVAIAVGAFLIILQGIAKFIRDFRTVIRGYDEH